MSKTRKNSIVYIDTIADLRNTIGSSGDAVDVIGYYTASDNIDSRTYYWDATSTEADNGGTIIQVTGVVTGRWKMKYSGAINVKWFGAKFNTTNGTDGNDDTQYFLNAISYLSSIGGGELSLPCGSTKITSIATKSSIRIKGQSSISTKVYIDGALSVGFKCNAHDTMLSADSATYGRFEHMNIIFTQDGQTAISYIGLSRWVSKDIVVVMNGKGATGFKCIPTVTAGAGGPSQWYNTFYDCFNVGSASSITAGAIGWDLGGTLATEEQVTTWDIYNGRTNQCAVGVRINGANNVNFHSHATEGNTDNYIVGTTGVGNRQAKNCNIYDFYIEGGTNGFTFNTNSINCGIFKGYATSIAGTLMTNNGTDNITLLSGENGIVTSDSNANGKFVKFGDGTMIATLIYTLTSPTLSALGSVWYVALPTITLPATFNTTGGAYAVSWGVKSIAGGFPISVSKTASSSDSTTALSGYSVFFATSAGGTSHTFSCTITGRWKA